MIKKAGDIADVQYTIEIFSKLELYINIEIPISFFSIFVLILTDVSNF
jgi:hypothetical protein